MQGFDIPLKALVRESEVPPQGQEVAITLEPERLLVFPVEDDQKAGRSKARGA